MTSIESKKKAKPKMVVAFLIEDRVFRCPWPYMPHPIQGKWDAHGLVKESDLD